MWKSILYLLVKVLYLLYEDIIIKIYEIYRMIIFIITDECTIWPLSLFWFYINLTKVRPLFTLSHRDLITPYYWSCSSSSSSRSHKLIISCIFTYSRNIVCKFYSSLFLRVLWIPLSFVEKIMTVILTSSTTEFSPLIR